MNVESSEHKHLNFDKETINGARTNVAIKINLMNTIPRSGFLL